MKGMMMMERVMVPMWGVVDDMVQIMYLDEYDEERNYYILYMVVNL